MTNELIRDTKKTEYWGTSTVRSHVMDITDYDTGGEAFSPATVGMSRTLHVMVEVISDDGYVAHYVESADTLKLYQESDNTSAPLGEAAAGSTATVRLTTVGK
jgi:hypothetical protein